MKYFLFMALLPVYYNFVVFRLFIYVKRYSSRGSLELLFVSFLGLLVVPALAAIPIFLAAHSVYQEPFLSGVERGIRILVFVLYLWVIYYFLLIRKNRGDSNSKQVN